MHDIIRDMIVESFRKDGVIKSFFTKEERVTSLWSPYSNNQTTTVAGQLLIDAAKTFDLSDCFKEIQQSMIDEIKNNHTKLIENIMLDMIVTGLSNNYDFVNRLTTQIQNIIRSTPSN